MVGCKNGGTCTTMDKCVCADGYTGTICQTREFTPAYSVLYIRTHIHTYTEKITHIHAHTHIHTRMHEYQIAFNNNNNTFRLKQNSLLIKVSIGTFCLLAVVI